MTSLLFLQEDYSRTFFPLNSTTVLLSSNEKGFSEHLAKKVLEDKHEEHAFLPQTPVYASKAGLHLRRTVKLDPMAEYFIYDLVYRNRSRFRKDFAPNRKSFGYRFERGKPIPASQSYAHFRSAVAKAKQEFKYSLKCDVATYFNALYHHDIVKWFSEAGATAKDVKALGQFLRQANTGRSVDCLPHGLYPCKMIGAEFLKFIDNAARLKSALLLRFMDDIYLFDDSSTVIDADFLVVQRLLGAKALSLNASKTRVGEAAEMDVPKKVGAMKRRLLRLRRAEITGYGAEDYEASPPRLTDAQTQYLLSLLKEPDVDESDAELVLVLLKDHGEDVLAQMYDFLEKYPSLSRKVYGFSRHVTDTNELARVLLQFVRQGQNVTEDQLFWIAKIAEERLTGTAEYKTLLLSLYEHTAATIISKAKVLEIPERRFGMPELREEHLRAGRSDWLAWAAAVGTRSETQIARNHLLVYFGKASTMNHLVAETVRDLPVQTISS